MYGDKKVAIVMPAYNTAATLLQTYEEVISQDYVDQVVIVDDGSRDETCSIGRSLEKAIVHVHEKNRGYGSTQKSGYRVALDEGADIVIMVHSDNQYTPKLIPAMASMLGNGLFDCVLGSRILGGHAWTGSMPRWRYVANRFLTSVENFLLQTRLSEFHTGYRGFTRKLLETLPLSENSDDFVFDNQMLAQIVWYGYTIGEASCPTRYASDSSSMSFRGGISYGLGCLGTGLEYRLAKMRLVSRARFPRLAADTVEDAAAAERPVDAA